MDPFKIPIVLIFFKREQKTLQILERIAQVKPQKLYLISDGPRDAEEADRVLKCRENIEKRINWDCEVIKNYVDVNKGVYNRIGLGAQWVLSLEESAIFLEDDNLPELTFFRFCEEMLNRYRDDTRVLWICGTNYLKEYLPEDGSSYVFTKHMLPCGWASWSHKFTKFYDGNLKLWNDPYIKKRIQYENKYKPLLNQDKRNWDRENSRILSGGKPNSWDYQMNFTMRVHGLYAIIPNFNQITNIGVDIDSIHGGISFDKTMTRRFCGLETRPMTFPLIHPKVVLTDIRFERLTAKIITLPLNFRILSMLNRFLKKILFIQRDLSLKGELKKRIVSYRWN